LDFKVLNETDNKLLSIEQSEAHVVVESVPESPNKDERSFNNAKKSISMEIFKGKVQDQTASRN
jgi:hypothetical protein